MAVTALLLLAGLAATASAFDPGAAPAPPRLVNLLEADLSSDPALRRAAERLSATAQLLLHDEPKPWGGPDIAHPPEAEGGERFDSLCSGSFIAPRWLATASHCIGPWRDILPSVLTVRRHLFRVRRGRLRRTGHEDYVPTGRIVSSYSDLSVIELDREAAGGARFTMAAGEEPYAAGARFDSLGFPNRLYAVPFAAVGCRVTDPLGGHEAPGRGYQGDCPAEGGMSGGPQYDEAGRQIGVVSTVHEPAGSTVNTSPRITALPPP